MRILIEEYQYDVSAVKDVLYGIDPLTDLEGKVSLHYVGYYYNAKLKDCVFILPKVLLNEGGLVFEEHAPESIIHIDKCALSNVEREFIYKFAVWVYRTIVVYKNDKRNDTSIVYHAKIAQVGKGRAHLSNTYLDILLSLLQFNRENQNFFFFVLKNIHSGASKINWTRTISKSTAIIQRNHPIYLNPVNKKRFINFDEELLVIFFSILNYIGDEYGFNKEICCRFELIKGQKFKTYLKGFGCTRLKQIKYKYYSDKALELWGLCYAFFDESRQVFINTEQKEYLLVKSFHVVFESIIDELIGDNPLPDGMGKKQEDGKIVDHLFTAESLIQGEHKQTYYIGDSKYYKIGHELTSESIYKQYTYARNVIQWNLDLFYDDGKENSKVVIRDDLTEGYNIIPNFFISAKMLEGVLRFNYATDGIQPTDNRTQKHIRTQFKNRLFDRDTLLLFHYDVNFLFVLSLYARNNKMQKAEWKLKMRQKFTEDIRKELESSYKFYAMQARQGVNGKSYIKEHFQDVLGKMYSPFENKSVYSLALDKAEEFKVENENLLKELRQYFFVEEVDLGENPETHLAKVAVASIGSAQVAIEPTIEQNVLTAFVPKSEENFDDFMEHKATSYTMRRIPTVNLMDVKYLLPMVAGDIDGVYKIEKMKFSAYKDELNITQMYLRFKLGEFISFGNSRVPIYKVRMQPGEVISMKDSLKLYGNEYLPPSK